MGEGRGCLGIILTKIAKKKRENDDPLELGYPIFRQTHLFG